jgi:transcriptional regulator with XRE-family HTH domain
MSAAPSLASKMLGERFRSARLQAQITQMELAHLAGINVANYGKIERGVGNPNFETLVRLAHVLGADPGDFVSGIRGDDLPERERPLTAREWATEKRKQRR